MKSKSITVALLVLVTLETDAAGKIYKPLANGRLVVSENNIYLEHENGIPFFWLGNTAWLMPERLASDEVEFYPTREHMDFNMFQSGHRRYGQRNGDGDTTF